LAALRHNIAVIREQIPPGTGITAVVKANAYGHGVEELSRELRYLVEMFAVANVVEARQLHRYAPGTPILILGPALPEERREIVESEFMPVVSSVDEARGYAELVEDGPPVNVHLAVDTGMGRIGVWQDDVVEIAYAISQISGIRLTGIATHLPVPDEDIEWTGLQLTHWREIVQALESRGVEIPIIHCLNSAGIIRFSGFARNMVRAGLMLYGSSPIPEFQQRLLPLLTWKSRVTLVRHVPAGRSISYGRTFITPHAMKIATVAAGYADGYQRHLSNKGAHVLVGGKRCTVLGRITMDQILVDVTTLPDVEMGDEVVLIGKQGSEEILAAELAEKSGTIAWEIFTSISNRVDRHYILD
jgi:alanine racemase